MTPEERAALEAQNKRDFEEYMRKLEQDTSFESKHLDHATPEERREYHELRRQRRNKKRREKYARQKAERQARQVRENRNSEQFAQEILDTIVSHRGKE